MACGMALFTRRLASDTPATFVAFDCLLRQLGRPLLARPFSDRRRALETVAVDMGNGNGLRVTSFTRELRTAKRWLNHRHKSLDGVVAKRLDLAYLPGARAMLKVKCLRTADCVVGGFVSRPAVASSDPCCSGFTTLKAFSITWALRQLFRGRKRPN